MAPSEPEPSTTSSSAADPDGNLPVSALASSRLLRTAIIIAVLGCVLGLMILPIVAPGQPLRYIGLVSILVTALIAAGLFRYGRLHQAYLVLVWGVWLSISVSTALNGGVRSPVIAAIPITILLGGLLLGYRTALTLSAATAALLIFFGLVADAGVLPLAQRAPPVWRATVLLISVAFSLAIVRYVLTNQAASFAAVRALNRSLAEQLERAEMREAALNERTREHTSLLNAQSKAGVGLFTVRSSRITYANQAFCDLIGYSEKELQAFASSELIGHPDDRARLRNNYLRRSRGEAVETRYIFGLLTKAGERREVELTATHVTDHPSADVLVIITDADQRAKAERALNKSKDMFKQAFDGSPLAIVISRLSDGLYLDVSLGWTAMFGWTRDELLGRTSLDVGIWPSAEARQAWAEQLRTHGRVKDMEASLLNKRRETLVTKMSASVIEVAGEACILVFIQDITEWRKAQASLLLSEERFANVFRTSPVPASIARVADGRFIEINDAFVEQFRRSREDTLGRTSLETGLWGDQSERMTWVTRLQAAGTLRDFETVMYRSDGERRIVAISAVIDNFGGESCVVAYLHDITDHYAAEEAIRTINADLEVRVAARTAELSDANRELEAFAYSISHDLRAPLRGIDGFSRLLEEDYGNRLDETGLEYLDRIRRAANRMGTLINDLLELSRVSRQAMHWQTVDLSAIAHETTRTLVDTTPERKVSVHIEPGCMVQGDPQLLQSVLENLIGNAWKYSSKTENAAIEFASTRVGDGATAFYVRDNGAGFDMAYASWLFTPFQRLHSADEFEGSGIGLASAARIIKRHGGRIWAEASPGTGACFYFTLSSTPTIATELIQTGSQQN